VFHEVRSSSQPYGNGALLLKLCCKPPKLLKGITK
jgi:hypothetical protein